MNKKIFSLLVISLILFACEQEDGTKWPVETTDSKPWTRWWWLGSAVDKANLTYNLEELSKAGIGGVEITPIYGLQGGEAQNIDYLSPKWMEMLSFTESEAKRLGIKVDMNTGTGWPFGGPEVTIEDAATKAIFQDYNVQGNQTVSFKVEVNDRRQKETAYLSRLMAYSKAGEGINLTENVKEDGSFYWEAPQGDWSLVALFVGKTFQQVKRAAPGGQGYVMNHFDEEAVKNYLKKFDTAFEENNVSFPSSFFNDSYEVYGADWTPTLLDKFEDLKGYKLELFFPELLGKGETEKSRRVISDYRETISEMLLNNFTVQWTKWANSKGATTRNQAHGSPANLIDIYAAVDIPECEIFGISDFDIQGLRKDSLIKENDGDPVTLKFASSASNIAGKKFTSAETFTWLTEHFRTSLSQCKPEIDQMFTSGVNHICFHGTPYSPKEAEWPGWRFYASINMSPTNSIWRDAPAFFSYIQRTQSFLQYGEPDNDLLVYFPIYDVWNEKKDDFYMAFAIHGLKERLPKFYRTVEKIRESGREVDYISDKFIMGSTVVNNKIKTSGGAIYEALVLPAVETIPVETIDKILELAKKGATVIFVEHYPNDIPGLHDLDKREASFQKIMQELPDVDFNLTTLNKIGKGKIVNGLDYDDLLTASNITEEIINKKFGIQYIRRKNEKGYHYFLTLLENRTINEWIPLGVDAKSAMFFNPMDGSSGKAKVRSVEGKSEVYLQLKSGESIILKTFTEANVQTEAWDYVDSYTGQIELNKNWEVKFIESTPSVNEVFKIDTLRSWTTFAHENVVKNMGTASYKTNVTIDKIDADDYLLELGDVRESAVVIINGEKVSTLFATPFSVYIGKHLHEGSNTVEIQVTNLPANRISDYDKREVEWRIFNEINFVDINYKNTKYDQWGLMPSGLLGPVAIQKVKFQSR